MCPYEARPLSARLGSRAPLRLPARTPPALGRLAQPLLLPNRPTHDDDFAFVRGDRFAWDPTPVVWSERQAAGIRRRSAAPAAGRVS